MAYHQCIGKTQNDDTYLADNDGIPKVKSAL